MKRTGYANIDSGAETAGLRAFKRNADWESAIKNWEAQKKNSLWIKAALKSFRRFGGIVPDKELDRRAVKKKLTMCDFL